MKIKEIVQYIDHFAPFSTAMSYDNCGLLIGSGETEPTGVMVSLDATMDALRRALENNCNVVVTHHPIIFNPLKRIHEQSTVYQYIRHGISVISAHTNLDMAKGGLNDFLGKRLGLTGMSGIGLISKQPYKKISVFVPEAFADTVMNAMADAGAGEYAGYSRCFFASGGKGYYQPENGSHPFRGETGKLHTEPEIRLEAICHPAKADMVIKAMLQTHPYERPAYDVIDDFSLTDLVYEGRAGVLATPLTPDALAGQVKERLGLDAVGLVCREGLEERLITRTAVCSGAGSSLLYDCAKEGVEALVTSEIKHNIAQDALEMGIVMVDAGHYGTEIIVVPMLAKKLEQRFPELPIFPFVQQPAIRAIY